MSDDKPVGTYNADTLKYDDKFWEGAAPLVPKDGETFAFTMGNFNMSLVATKKEAQMALNDARARAQRASEVWVTARDKMMGPPYNDRGPTPAEELDADIAHRLYTRAVNEFEEAINEMARFETPGDDD